MKKLIAGNWKMNGTLEEARDLISGILEGLRGNPALFETCDFLVCPPFIHMSAVKHELDGSGLSVALGAQDCALTKDGAYTGDISAAMLEDLGAGYVILGHSERRQYHKERDTEIAAKAGLAHGQGLVTVICVGELEEEREAGKEKDIVGRQLAEAVPASATAENTVIAYEPVWAIGTGKTATPEDVRVMHSFIREKLQERLADAANMRILYGGSVKPSNAEELFKVENFDGALIGGASLKADQYLGIAEAA